MVSGDPGATDKPCGALRRDLAKNSGTLHGQHKVLIYGEKLG